MQTSIFIARLLGPALVVIGAAILLEPRAFRTLIAGFLESPALTYLAALIGLLGGLALVLTHNVWSADWRVLITLIGWITVLKTLALILLPGRMTGLGKWLLRHGRSITASALITISTGAILSWFGYCA